MGIIMGIIHVRVYGIFPETKVLHYNVPVIGLSLGGRPRFNHHIVETNGYPL